MNTPAKPRNCLYCSKEVKGRKDKKFCNDGCRNSFHNDLNSPTNEIVNPVFNILKKNRSVILDFLMKNNLLVTREELLQAGFIFKYQTEFRSFNDQDYIFYFDVGIEDDRKGVCRLFYAKEFDKPPFAE